MKKHLTEKLTTKELMQVCEFVGGGDDPPTDLMIKLQDIFVDEIQHKDDDDPYEWMFQRLSSLWEND